MKLEIEEFLEHIDEWKFKVAEKLKGMTPAQRRDYWNEAREWARARGLNVVDPERPAKQPAAKHPAKRARKSGKPRKTRVRA